MVQPQTKTVPIFNVEVLPPERQSNLAPFAEPPVRAPLTIDIQPAPPPTRTVPEAFKPHNQPQNLPPKQTEQYQENYTNQPATTGKPTGGFATSGWNPRRATPAPTPTSIPRYYDPTTAAGDQLVEQGLGPFLVGIDDELNNKPNLENRVEFYDGIDPNYFSTSSYLAGRDLVWDTRNTINNGWEAVKDGLENIPNFSPRDFRLPEVNLPPFNLPEFDIPPFEFPEINFPPIRNPFNPPAQNPTTSPRPIHTPNPTKDPTKEPVNDPQEERDDLIDKEDDRRNDTERPTDPKQDFEDFRDKIPDNCYTVMYWGTFKTWSHSPGQPYENMIEQPWTAGYGPVEMVRPDNSPGFYFKTPNGTLVDGERRGGGFDQGFGLSAYKSFLFNDSSSIDIQVHYWFVGNRTQWEDLFTFTRTNEQGNVINRVRWPSFHELPNKIISTSALICNPPQPNKPPFGKPPDRPRFPPKPPRRPPRKKPPMSCCSCAQISQIISNALGSMNYSVVVPVVSCSYNLVEKKWIPEMSYTTIQTMAVNTFQAQSQAQVYTQLADLAWKACEANNAFEILGVEDYPISLPKSLLTRRQGLISELTPDFIERMYPEEQTDVHNLPRLITWFVEQFDALMGEWEVPLEIKDIDTTKQGDQPISMRIPNLAEYAAESMGILLELTTDMKTLINICFKTLAESGQDKQQNFKSYKLVETIADFLGFKYKEKGVEMPLLFTPGKTKITEILQETVLNVPVAEYDEKSNFQMELMRIRKMAAILDAQFFRKIDPSGDVGKQVMKYLREGAESAEEITEKEDDNFEQFIDDAQIGFINTPGITDRANPYGQPFENRPRIKNLGKLNQE